MQTDSSDLLQWSTPASTGQQTSYFQSARTLDKAGGGSKQLLFFDFCRAKGRKPPRVHSRVQKSGMVLRDNGAMRLLLQPATCRLPASDMLEDRGRLRPRIKCKWGWGGVEIVVNEATADSRGDGFVLLQAMAAPFHATSPAK